MATVTLRLAPRRAHVRTARLVAVAMARRSGVSEESLDEIRLAVGEACGRAVQLHERYGLGDPVELTMSDDGRFEVVVSDQAPAKPEAAGPTSAPGGGAPAGAGAGVAEPGGVPAQRQSALEWEEPLDAGLGLALLAALVDDISVDMGGSTPGTTVRMSWPIDALPPDDPDLLASNTAV
jgi:serine/threonine-protein kinase RsbW